MLFNTTSRLGSNPCLCLCLPASVTCPFALPCVSGGCLPPCLSCRRRLRCLPRASAAACACLPALSQRCRRRLPRLDPTLLPVTALPVPPHGLKRQARWARPDPCPASSQRCCGHLHRLQPARHRLQPALLRTPAPPPANAPVRACLKQCYKGVPAVQSGAAQQAGQGRVAAGRRKGESGGGRRTRRRAAGASTVVCPWRQAGSECAATEHAAHRGQHRGQQQHADQPKAARIALTPQPANPKPTPAARQHTNSSVFPWRGGVEKHQWFVCLVRA